MSLSVLENKNLNHLLEKDVKKVEVLQTAAKTILRILIKMSTSWRRSWI